MDEIQPKRMVGNISNPVACEASLHRQKIAFLRSTFLSDKGYPTPSSLSSSAVFSSSLVGKYNQIANPTFCLRHSEGSKPITSPLSLSDRANTSYTTRADKPNYPYRSNHFNGDKYEALSFHYPAILYPDPEYKTIVFQPTRKARLSYGSVNFSQTNSYNSTQHCHSLMDDKVIYHHSEAITSSPSEPLCLYRARHFENGKSTQNLTNSSTFSYQRSSSSSPVVCYTVLAFTILLMYAFLCVVLFNEPCYGVVFGETRCLGYSISPFVINEQKNGCPTSYNEFNDSLRYFTVTFHLGWVECCFIDRVLLSLGMIPGLRTTSCC